MPFLNIPQEFANRSAEQIVAEAGSGPPPLIPEGNYQAMIVKSESKSTTHGGEMLVLVFSITQGEHAGTELSDNLNVVNSNPVAVKIAFEDLARIVKAVGLQNIPSDSTVLHNKPLVIKVKTEKGKAMISKETGKPVMNDDGTPRHYSDRSIVDGYLPLPKPATAGFAQSSPTTANPTASMPWATAR